MAKKAAKKQKPKAPKKPSKEQREKLIAEKIDELMEARTNHALACVDWEQAHATAGAKKKNMESLQARMNQVVGTLIGFVRATTRCRCHSKNRLTSRKVLGVKQMATIHDQQSASIPCLKVAS